MSIKIHNDIPDQAKKDLEAYYNDRVNSFSKIIVHATKDKDLVFLWKKVLEKAKNGDLWAAQIALKYLIPDKQTSQTNVQINMTGEDIKKRLDEALNITPIPNKPMIDGE